jgi:hypothetical protein
VLSGTQKSDSVGVPGVTVEDIERSTVWTGEVVDVNLGGPGVTGASSLGFGEAIVLS